MIFVVIGVLVAILLLLRIIQALAGERVVTTVKYQSPSTPPPDPDALQRAERAAAACATCWVRYVGMTPPLELLLRPVSEDTFLQFARHELAQACVDDTYINALLPITTARAMAAAYVVDWRGPRYPNGSEMPFSSQGMADMLVKDEHLMTFVSDNVNDLRRSG